MGDHRPPDPTREVRRQQAHDRWARGGRRGDAHPPPGCRWAALPKDLPPRSTVNDYLRRWDADRTLDRIHHALYVLCRERAGREASPTAAVIDSQSRAEEHTSELQSRQYLVCRLLLEQTK